MLRRFVSPFTSAAHIKGYPLLQGEGRVRMGFRIRNHRPPVVHMNPILTLALSLKEREFLCVFRACGADESRADISHSTSPLLEREPYAARDLRLRLPLHCRGVS